MSNSDQVMTEEELLSIGVPRPVAVYLRNQEPPLIRWPTVCFYIVLVAGIIVGWFWIWPILEVQIEQNALSAAKSSGALLYYHNFGIGPLIGLFAWNFASAWIFLVIVAFVPRQAAVEFLQAVTSSLGTFRAAGTRLRMVSSERADDPHPTRYIRRFIILSANRFGLLAAAFALASTIVTARELNAFTLYFSDRYEEQHTFLPDRTIRYWANANRIEVGCNHTDDGDDPIYEVHFKNDGSTRIDGAEPVSANWVTEVEKIDAALVRAGAHFEPWLWLDREPYDPRCLMAYSSLLGEDTFNRFRRLIRAPQLGREVVADGPER